MASYVQEFTEALKLIQDARDNSSVSLPKFTKPSIIESPNFMQDILAEEPVVNDILKNLYNVYVGYIISALQMNDLVADGRRIRDLLAPVSTIGSFESYIDTNALVSGLSGSLEAIRTRSATNSERTIYNADGTVTTEITESETTDKYLNPGHSVSGQQIDLKNVPPIASGRQIEIKFNVGKDREPITLTLTVKFNTRIVPTPVFEYVLSQDFNRSIADRWFQYRSGEIRFIKDFILSLDRAERRAKALKSDSSYALQDILRHQSKSIAKHMMKTATNQKSYNIANSILMMEEETVKYHTKKAGFDLRNIRDRRRFFDATYSLFIVLVDTRYSRVTIYTNGIDDSASYSFNELKASAASDKMSLTEVMEYLTKNQMPKF